MNKKNTHIAELIPEYLDNSLVDTERIIFEKHLNSCKACAKELESHSTLFKAFEDENITIPSKKLKTNFFKQLEQEKKNQDQIIQLNAVPAKKSKRYRILKIAASIAVLIGSFMMGKYHQTQESNKDIALLEDESKAIKQTAMLSLMENVSARKRIQGVNYIMEFENPDEEIVRVITHRMLYDENTNVRLTAVEALSKFVKSKAVKAAFINALETEKDPSVQIALIKNLVRVQENKAYIPMRKLLEQEDTQPFIKKEINQILSQII